MTVMIAWAFMCSITATDCEREAVVRALPAFSPHDIKSRAAPGSVKPAILEMIKKQPGLTPDQIQAKSGAKHNSVRGTLWALEKEGKVERHDGKYAAVIIPSSSSTSGNTSEDGTPDAGASGDGLFG